MEPEIWKDIEGYEGLYQISNYGRILHLKTRRFKATQTKPNEYVTVVLYKDNIPKYFRVHRLVAIHFIPNLENKPQVNHKDLNPQNNSYSNLEWVTGKENTCHARDAGRLSGKKNYDTTLNFKNPKPVKCIETNTLYPSRNQVVRRTGIRDSQVQKAIKYQILIDGHRFQYI